MLDLPLEHTATDAGSAFGAAMLAGIREGVFADAADAVARCVHAGSRVEPDAEWVEVYAAAYARFRRLYPALKPLEVT